MYKTGTVLCKHAKLPPKTEIVSTNANANAQRLVFFNFFHLRAFFFSFFVFLALALALALVFCPCPTPFPPIFPFIASRCWAGYFFFSLRPRSVKESFVRSLSDFVGSGGLWGRVSGRAAACTLSCSGGPENNPVRGTS